MHVCGCEASVIVFLNPWGLSQLSIHAQFTAHTSPPGKTKQKRLRYCCAPQPSRGDQGLMSSPKQPPKLAMLLLLALLLLCNGVGNAHCSRIHENSADLHALLDFHRGITDDPKGALSNWNTTTHFCRWNGVTCTTTRPFRVSWLNLTCQNLQGHITPSLGNLTFLNLLELSYNRFIGTFPVLNNLQLQYLIMTNNSLTGINPNALSNCSNWGYLDFFSNLLVGPIPRN
ncbi:LRR receptor-like serine/threonine-protein kinase EFR [Triticum dicoccoides]|uniref:LRR receptor-like serine/threonine-protein kinase EFR n=1 Tax=Triticum dicoccoides TaxID=85692 RepID=UPI0018917DD0|nr:LRR receptor-like serine/threonine-protein kinase EFR [Triticum dicoccoides]